MSLQKIPHDSTKYQNNPVELLNINNRNRIGYGSLVNPSETKLLIPGTITDLTGKTITTYGDTVASTAQSKIGGSSIYFDGTGDYLSLNDSDDFYLSGDFTIDAWIYLTVDTDLKTIIYQGDNNRYSTYYWLRYNSGFYSEFEVNTGSGSTNNWLISVNSSTGTKLSSNTWNHIAVSRFGNQYYLFHNGISLPVTLGAGSMSNAIPNMAYAVNIGRYAASTYYFQGYMSHVRITKGKALWTSDFTVPLSLSDYGIYNNYIGA